MNIVMFVGGVAKINTNRTRFKRKFNENECVNGVSLYWLNVNKIYENN